MARARRRVMNQDQVTDDETRYLSVVSGEAIRRLVGSRDVTDTLSSLLHLGYESHAAPPWLKLLQALLLPHDPRVDRRVRARVKARLRSALPKCFLWPRHGPGRRPRGRPLGRAAQNHEQIRRVYPELVALYEKGPTLRDVARFLTTKGIAIGQGRLGDIEDIIEAREMASFARARETLALALDAGRGTIDKVVVRRRWTNVSEAAMRRTLERLPLPLTRE